MPVLVVCVQRENFNLIKFHFGSTAAKQEILQALHRFTRVITLYVVNTLPTIQSADKSARLVSNDRRLVLERSIE